MRSARLFAAISFSPAEKAELFTLSQRLKEKALSGRFTEQALLHITLHFFGQTELNKLSNIESAMKKAATGTQPFALVTGRAGTFGRRDSAVLWLGIDDGATELKALQAKLETALAAAGFPIESREFKAHLTVARDVRLAGTAGEIGLPKATLKANGITLMESTTQSGRLEYVPLLNIPL